MSEKFLPDKSLLETIRDSAALDAVSGILEVGVDSMLEEGVGRDLPFVGSLVGIWKTGAQVRDAIFVKKVARFLKDLKSIKPEERKKFFEKLDKDPKKKGELAETLLMQLERLDDLQKTDILAKSFKAYIQEFITLEQFKELSAIIDRMFSSDMHSLPFGSQPSMMPPAAATRLTACGVLEIHSIPQIKAPEAQNKYVRTPIGNLLYDIFFEDVTRT